MKKFSLILIILFILGRPWFGANAAGSLSNVSLSINPQTAGATATWTISFNVPQDTKLGHILISLGGYPADLGSAELFVTGIPQGNPQVGKSNPNCVINCDDIRYYYTNPIDVKQNTQITFTLNKVKNPATAGPSGVNFIDLFSSKYPQLTLAFSSGENLITLSDASGNVAGQINSNTNSSLDQNPTDITKVTLNQLFFQAGSKTTDLSKIKDATKVTNLTLDLLGKEKVVFNGTLDLSQPEAINFFSQLSDFMTFDNLSFEVKPELTAYFKTPLNITFYNLPFVADADVWKDGALLTKDKLTDYAYLLYNNAPQISFTISDAGKYQLIPHLDLNIEDNQKIESDSNQTVFSGRISDPQAVIDITLGGQDLGSSVVKINSATGDFTFPISLVSGPNLIQVQATSAYGQIDKINRTVLYIPPQNTVSQPKSYVSPTNIAAVVLTFLAIIIIWAISRLARRRK